VQTIKVAEKKYKHHVSVPSGEGERVDEAVTVERRAEEVYCFSRPLENLPRFLRHVQCVTVHDDLHSHWVVNTLAGKEVKWDAEIIEDLAPGPDDFVIDKSRYSAFYGTRLEPVLNGLGVRSLVLCGVTTNICVETTARDASQRDYRVFVVSDATGELTRERHENALAILDYGFGWVVSVRDVVATLEPEAFPVGEGATP